MKRKTKKLPKPGEEVLLAKDGVPLGVMPFASVVSVRECDEAESEGGVLVEVVVRPRPPPRFTKWLSINWLEKYAREPIE